MILDNLSNWWFLEIQIAPKYPWPIWQSIRLSILTIGIIEQICWMIIYGKLKWVNWMWSYTRQKFLHLRSLRICFSLLWIDHNKCLRSILQLVFIRFPLQRTLHLWCHGDLYFSFIFAHWEHLELLVECTRLIALCWCMKHERDLHSPIRFGFGFEAPYQRRNKHCTFLLILMIIMKVIFCVLPTTGAQNEDSSTGITVVKWV